MANLKERFEKIGLNIPEILLPADNVDISKWAVIACDQFTSEQDYWRETEKNVGDAISTLNIILPEAYLEEGDTEELIEKINTTQKQYLESGVLKKLKPGFILVERSTEFAESRKGLILAVDLENYSFETGANAMIRPTEGTVLDRLPPRMNIRRGACLDLPHILLLIDDPKGGVIETLFEKRDQMEKLYDFELMQKGGHLKGWFADEAQIEAVADAFEALAEDGFLFAVGDGNHSLAAAKQLWEEKKQNGASADDPARFALVEVENIHDAGLIFHPIHRVLFGVDEADFTKALSEKLNGTIEAGQPVARTAEGNDHFIGLVSPTQKGVMKFTQPQQRLTVEFVQEFLDEYLAANPDVKIDYIHDTQPALDLGVLEGNIALFLPDLNKDVFFQRMINVGPYPRKTFSIGEAPEKRYYLESRRLTR